MEDGMLPASISPRQVERWLLTALEEERNKRLTDINGFASSQLRPK